MSCASWGSLRKRFCGALILVAVLGLILSSKNGLGQQPTQDSGQPSPQTAPETQAPPNGPDKAPSENPMAADASLKLGAGDLVDVNVFGVPELSTKARVSNSGELYLPLIEYVHVADLSVEEAQKVIAKRLEDGGFVKNPHVTIFVSEYASGATIIGEVAHQGVYPVVGDRRLFDMISAAGGLTEKAGRTVSVTHRDQPQKPDTIQLARNITDNPESNVTIRPGDTIEVHRAPIVYVVGDVGRPSGLLVDSGNITVLQAIALAGGPNRTAKLSGTRLIRKGGPTGMTETPIPLQKMLRAQAPDIPLEPNDILIVPVNGGKIFAARTFQAAVNVASSMAVYTLRP
jgi:polysaccharide export outer membrane protein